MIIAEDAQRGRPEFEITSARWLQTQPSRHQNPKKMAAGEDEYIAVHFSDSGDNAICPISNILGRFAVGTAITED